MINQRGEEAPFGRPTEYSDFVLKVAKAYLKDCQEIKDGKVKTPYVEELALMLDHDDETLMIWANNHWPTDYSDLELRGKLKYPDFSATIKKIKVLQKLRLQQRAVQGANAAGSIFLLKANHRFVDRVDFTIKGEKIESPAVIIKQKK